MSTSSRWLMALCLATLPAAARADEPVVPGTGQRITAVGDDFEDASWVYHLQGDKSSRNLDKRERAPTGESENGRWYEGAKRGHPDIVRRIETPAGGLPGSGGALLLQTLQSGVPGRYSGDMQQDDFVADVSYALEGALPVWQSPNVVVRVFLPPDKYWEKRSGPHFGFRVSLITTLRKTGFGRLTGRTEKETYWPGMFIDRESTADGAARDRTVLRVRCDDSGGEYEAIEMRPLGWWTLGMSVTRSGQVHYYARPGVGNLTAQDRLGSEYPYGFQAESFKTFFFNVCNRDDGSSWSTPFILDDPQVFIINSRTANR